MVNYIEEIILKLTDMGVKFIICGGVAAVLHGVERMTVDIDLSLDMDKINLKKFLSAVKIMNLKPRAPVVPESILDPKNREKMIREKDALVFTFVDPELPFKQIDVFLGEENSYSSLIKDSEKISIGNIAIWH